MIITGVITSEGPNPNLIRYEGTLEWNNNRYALDINHIILRGCTIRNTEWCYGIVVFAGHDTKLMMNSGKPMFKRTQIDKLTNQCIIGVGIF